MATRLKNLRIKKVDFVDEGANPDAHIMLYKNRDVTGKPIEEGNTNVLKRLVSAIAKVLDVKESQLGDAVEEVQKGDSESFDERYVEVKNRKIADEIWDVCFALQSSLYSILNDDDLDGAQTSTAMTESLDEFCEVVKDAITQWSNGKANNIVRKNDEITEAELENMKSVQKRLAESIEKSVVVKEEKNIESKGDKEMALVDIDKSKLTSAERAFLEDIEKRCGTNQTTGQEGVGNGTGAEDDTAVTKSAPEPLADDPVSTEPSKPAPEPSDGEDIYKGLHPLVREEIQSLRKFREDAENRELNEIAKKYEIIGKKPEELVPMFKNLKAVGGSAFDNMVALLDQAVETAESSGAFSEIGKSGHGESTDGEAWAKAEAKAAEIMKTKTGLTKAQALDAVFMAEPELAEKCEKEE
ncbi:MAG: hypothetical protein NC293_07670 [Roseburia sp.]|nr:hypothetical protein [Roseburia sp.]